MHARNRTQIALAVIVVMAAMSAAGCLVPRPSGTLRIGVLALPSTDDPATSANPGLLGLAFETLIARGPDGNYYPGLAKDWSASPDGRSITLSLKPGVKFSNGDALSGENAAASLRFLVEQDKAALGPVDKIEASGDSALLITLARPYPPIWGALASPGAAIAVRKPEGQVSGTGPFIITQRTVDALSLTVNKAYRWAPEYYRVRGPARVETVSVKLYPDAASLTEAVNANQLDVAGATGMLPPNGWTKTAAPGESLLYLGFDVNEAPYNDARVRRAIALLTVAGRESAAKAYPGWVATTAFLPGAAWGATEVSPGGDATSLLSEAGYSRGADGLFRSGEAPLRLVISASQRAEDQAVAGSIAETLRAAGVDAAVGTPDAGGSQAFLARYTWGEPDILYYMLHTGAEANRTGYSDARADRLLEAAAGAMNLGDRQAVYQALQQRLAEDSPWVPLLASREEWLVRGSTSNIRVGTGGRLYLTTARIR